jgi:class 3 adenylate cyclase
VELTIEDVAGRAGVDVAYVRRLVELGVVGPEGDGYREQDAHVTALLQDGDVYGRTVNVASRIADLAQAGDVLTTEGTMRQVDAAEVDWTLVGPAELQGVAIPVKLYRATLGGSHPSS